ncbi:hypothetical protein KM043_007066 [Ampulex compressa]|nr:hypothetical protein KM043_007066 [Ampulex compressa]
MKYNSLHECASKVRKYPLLTYSSFLTSLAPIERVVFSYSDLDTAELPLRDTVIELAVEASREEGRRVRSRGGINRGRISLPSVVLREDNVAVTEIHGSAVNTYFITASSLRDSGVRFCVNIGTMKDGGQVVTQSYRFFTRPIIDHRVAEVQRRNRTKKRTCDGVPVFERFSLSSRHQEQNPRELPVAARTTSDLSKVAFRNNRLRLTELPDLWPGHSPDRHHRHPTSASVAKPGYKVASQSRSAGARHGGIRAKEGEKESERKTEDGMRRRRMAVPVGYAG